MSANSLIGEALKRSHANLAPIVIDLRRRLTERDARIEELLVRVAELEVRLEAAEAKPLS